MIGYYKKYIKYKVKYIELKRTDNNENEHIESDGNLELIDGGKNKSYKIKLFNKWLKDKFEKCWNIPGLAVVIFNSDDILYKKVFGYANIKIKQNLKITDKFCIVSCSKSILCLAITLAIKNGDIPNLWDMNLGDVFDKINDKYKNVPIKYLACHTSGISDKVTCSDKISPLKKYENMDGIKSRRLVSKYLLKKEPSYEPNSKFEYSNFGYGVLGHIAEKYSGHHYSELINKYVFNPLNIDANYDYFQNTNCAQGHKVGSFHDLLVDPKYEPLKEKEHINPIYEEPSGVIHISPLQSAKYMQHYLLTNNIKGELFDNGVYTLLTTPIINNYALGLKNNNKIIAHQGGYFCMTTDFSICPSNNIGIIVNCNTYNFVKNIKNIIEKFTEIFCP